MSKDDFIVWKNDPITKAFYISLNQRREDVKESLVAQAGIDSIDDAKKSGYCQALVDVFDTDFMELEEE